MNFSVTGACKLLALEDSPVLGLTGVCVVNRRGVLTPLKLPPAAEVDDSCYWITNLLLLWPVERALCLVTSHRTRANPPYCDLIKDCGQLSPTDPIIFLWRRG